ncbi:RdRP-domain-containing protein [Coprinopsis sp. MPI-PUGE-AT-0042]|nr:RdRP-domain-containing protein [Coprinopsis sp. MPI-PUGE-AT-0042]
MKNLEIKCVPTRHVTAGDVKKAIAAVVHGAEFISSLGHPPNHPLVNFEVRLNEHPTAPHHCTNNGSGLLTFPTDQVQGTFWRLYRRSGLSTTLRGQKAKLFFHPSTERPDLWLIDELASTPYINPTIEEERQEMVNLLDFGLRVTLVQVGILFRKNFPGVRTFSGEWSRQCDITVGRIKYDYDSKSIQISTHEPSEPVKQVIIVAVGYDSFGDPFICVDALTPPSLVEREAYPTLTGKASDDRKILRGKLLGSLCAPHAAVAPYAYQLRRTYPNSFDIAKDLDIMPLLMDIRGRGSIEAEGHGFTGLMRSLVHQLKTLPFPIGFQLESVGQEHPPQPIPGSQPPSQAARIGTHSLRTTTSSTTSCGAFVHRQQNVDCYHVTCTPSRFVLEGPYPTGFNRIIRKYRPFAHHFLRVEFRDEGGQFITRSDFDVDATQLVQQRIGGVLKHGFHIAGRHFQFLAYASSSLKVHSTWFVHPFTDDRGRNDVFVDAQRIRDEIVPPNIVANQKLLTKPSKYAARVALAFTTSEAWEAVKLKRHEWDGTPPTMLVKVLNDDGVSYDDKEVELPPFTDGVGVMSQKLRDRIWEANGDPDSMRPSAYMLRFLGFKGVISVDPELDKDPSGFQLKLRPSMGKFESLEDDPSVSSEVALDIAEVYDRPKKLYLNRPLVMLLEHLGVSVDTFRTLQNAAVAEAKTIDVNLEQFSSISKLALRFKNDLDLTLEQIDSPFWKNLRQISFNHVMAVIRYEARILVPESYLLVGVADEGPAYKEMGYQNVFTLSPNSIFACIQEDQNSEPVWLKGTCAVTRNPVVHRGDVQRVYAIGKPPPNMFCAFAHLRNVVVFPSEGRRSLPSCLAGGDLDGDQYAVIQHDPLLPASTHDPSVPDNIIDDRTLPENRIVEAGDICDFVVEYINSDVLGMLSVKLLRMAGYDDERCIQLASLCSQAVDYPKKGVPVSSASYEQLRTPKKFKPDWEQDASIDQSGGIHYTSNRALGHLYRSKHFDNMGEVVTEEQEAVSTKTAPAQPYTDLLSQAIKQKVEEFLGPGLLPTVSVGRELKVQQKVKNAFQEYSEELRYIRFTHSLYAKPESRLLEAEVVAGTIECRRDLKRLRKERISRMKDHTVSSVKRVRAELMGVPEVKGMQTLQTAWNAWGFSQVCQEEGGKSFGLIALRIIFECWDHLAGK